MMKVFLIAIPSILGLAHCFQTTLPRKARALFKTKLDESSLSDTPQVPDEDNSRRSLIVQGLTLGSILASMPNVAAASVGSLPEFQDTNAILRGITIKVADKSQQEAMVSFLSNGFDFDILRQRISGGVEEIWMGFGPERLRIPEDFEAPVSSFAKYGGHASICIVYDSSLTSVLYRTGNDAPGTNIAYVQVSVPGYRISQMVKSGANVLDAYGIVNVVSPSGLPFRGIVGIVPDPIMFVAINCENIKKSKAFYEELGFVEQEYPFARPSKGLGQFEPPQSAKSVYLGPSQNCMGVLLLPSRKKTSANPVVESLNVVYNPASGASDDDSFGPYLDPSGVTISFQSVPSFEAEENITR